ncbi:MAG: glucokinase [Gammaproteobacteria bacterium]|nr:glucokinase [Gammaproteobacteria bacterium]
MNNKTILIADIGGTNARFAISSAESPYFFHDQILQCLDHANLIEAIDSYLYQHNYKQLDALCFAVAGPIKEEAMSFLNNDWSLSADDLGARYNTDSVVLMNDFQSISYSLAQLCDDDILNIGSRSAPSLGSDFTVGVIGPGSGLGIAGLRMQAGVSRPVATEGGHIGFAPDSPLQIQILEYLQSEFGRVSNERLLSGPGLVNIHEALCIINKLDNPGISPADIAVASREYSDPTCVQTMQLFFEILGQVAGDTVLSLGAYDRIYIGGGIAQRYPNQLLRSAFRSGFENKGRYRTMMESVPSMLIMHQNPGLLGASFYANQFLDVAE